MVRPVGRTNGRGRAERLLVATCLLVAVAAGAVWTGSAVADGAMASMLLRFSASLAGAFYYLALYRVASGRTLALR